ncbi:mycothiol synthase [Psychromicrobium silvestre]|uniref:Mycothiol acetyltransferase n=1 Tax=Psychromicrobium silvestre TaxID=1645614 RepID=A0A7Y9LTJ7_9MICC|nr:mycothiol synthase [Psychromicrobium silvestre]NYE95323.1 mycothiol synthase [Psychromicrobium silvestre]
MVEPELDKEESMYFREEPIEPKLLAAMRRLAASAEASDGHPPFSDQSWVEVRSDPSTARIFTACTAREAPEEDGDVGGLAGIAVVTGMGEAGAEEAGLLELVIDPDQRHRGWARSLIQAVEHSLGSAAFHELEAWSHGDHPAAAKLAKHHGFLANRELWQMRLNVTADDEPANTLLPEGLRLRSFVPGQDESAWLAVNAEAFAHHPEQGSTTLADLQAREAEDWFDPEGFLLAVDQQDEILGFHWTKVHPAAGQDAGGDDGQEAGQEALGEVYVVGVSPRAQGLGLGKALTSAGLSYLRGEGLKTILLYVDADNTAAVALYQKLGFSRWDTDVMYVSAQKEQGKR